MIAHCQLLILIQRLHFCRAAEITARTVIQHFILKGYPLVNSTQGLVAFLILGILKIYAGERGIGNAQLLAQLL